MKHHLSTPPPPVKSIGLSELVMLKPGDPRWRAPRTNLDACWDAYQLAQRWDAHRWLMERFTRRL